MDPTTSAAWIGAMGGVVGGAVGGALAYLAAVKSLNSAAAQAEKERRTGRCQARRSALLALTWELEVNQERLDRAKKSTARTPYFKLSHTAHDAAAPWFASLPGRARNTVHEALLTILRYNDPDNAEVGTVTNMVDQVIPVIATARKALDSELAAGERTCL